MKLRTYLLSISILVFPLFSFAEGEEAPREEKSEVASKECVCPNKGANFKEIYESSSVIFIGRADKRQSSPLKPDKIGTKFQIIKHYKGFEDFPLKHVVVYTDGKDSPCHSKFTIGADYLVFGTGTPAFYKTNSCLPNDFIETAKLNVERLNRMNKKEEPVPSPKKKKKKEPMKMKFLDQLN